MDLLLVFSGRIGRIEWCLGQLTAILWIIVTLALAVEVVGFSPNNFEITSLVEKPTLAASTILFGTVIIFPAVWVTLAVNIKRLHDRNKSGFWLLACGVPYIGILWHVVECGLMPGTAERNTYGLPPTSFKDTVVQDVDILAETTDWYGSESNKEAEYGYQPIVNRNRKSRKLGEKCENPEPKRRDT